jgi:secretion/DNA translocation related TadE-like protein
MSDKGSGSILAIGILSAIMILAATSIPLYAVLATRSQVQAAADAAALAAADVRRGVTGGFPCDVAGTVARANRTELTECDLDGYVATVEVRRQTLGFELRSTATAGPPATSAPIVFTGGINSVDTASAGH